MKYLPILFLALILSNCGFNPDFGQQGSSVPPPDTLPHSILYGLSWFDAKEHFVKVETSTGKLTTISTLDTITWITGPMVIDPDRGYYCFITTNNVWFKLAVINISDGTIVKSFALKYFNTGGMVYNSNTKKINAISYYDNQNHFVEIDLDLETMTSLQTLSGLHGYNSSTVDNENKRYYVLSLYDTLKTINTENGTIVDAYAMPKGTDGIVCTGANRLFGMSLNPAGNKFYSFNAATKEATMLQSFEGGITGYPSNDVSNGVYFYSFGVSNGKIALNCIDVKTGYKIKTDSVPYQTDQLIPWNGSKSN